MPYFRGRYLTDDEVREIDDNLTSEESDEFRSRLSDHRSSSDPLLSAAVGFATGSSLLGGLVGGSLVGGILGDLAEGTDDSIF